MNTILSICAVATLLVIGIALWQAWQIIKKGKHDDKPSEDELRKLERRLNVIHVGVYILVVILVFHFYMMFTAR